MANGGTIFFDEIGNLDMRLQVDLLRVIETKQFMRLGGEQVINVDFRIICATNKNLEKAVEEGSFREDLYYRLNVFSVFLSPLRERRSDIPLLAQHFLQMYSVSMNKNIKSISSEALDLLIRYDWPGNVRELQNAIERAMVVGKPPCIRVEDLPFQLNNPSRIREADSLADVEKIHIIDILDRTGWNITRAAEILKIDRVTLYNKIEKYGLRK